MAAIPNEVRRHPIEGREDLIKEDPRWIYQMEMERDMMDNGIARYQVQRRLARERGDVSQCGVVKKLQSTMLDKVAQAVREYCFKEADKKGRGVKTVAFKYLMEFDAEVVAWVAIGQLLKWCEAEYIVYNSTAEAIAKDLERHLVITRYKEKFPKRFAQDLRNMQENKTSALYQERVVKHLASKKYLPAVLNECWTDAEHFHVGSACIEFVVNATGLFHVKNIRRPGGNKFTKEALRVLYPDPALGEWLSKADAKAMLRNPEFGVSLVPPKPWRAPEGGAYYSDALQQQPIRLIGAASSGAVSNKKQYAEYDMSRVYEAVNYVQDVPWMVNEDVLGVMLEFWRRAQGGSVEARNLFMPERQTPEELPPRLTDEEWAALSDEERTERRYAGKEWHKENVSMIGHKLDVEKVLAQGNTYRQFGHFYFPHRLDFRGRMYPLPSGLMPQGDDKSKGLLLFAEGRKLGARGLYWLKVHVANCYGRDKLSYADRVKWVDENLDALKAVAEDPYVNRLWVTEGDGPWCALAASYELFDAVTASVPEDFVSHLPVRLDGTCNGIQHFSAMSRDPIGGAAVNLLPSDKPADIYSDVARVVTANLEEMQVSEPDDAKREMAGLWFDTVDGKVPRSLTKSAVMTLPYGAKHSARMNAVDNWLFEHRLGSPNYKDLCKAASFMASQNFLGVKEIVKAPVEVMEWLQKTVKLMTSEVIWVTPTGFPLRQAYYKSEVQHLIKTRTLSGDVLYGSTWKWSSELNLAKQASAIAANFVHSLDAACLMFTVLRLKSYGVTSFGCIHDSYGTHAADIDTMNECIRAAFVWDLYQSHDVLNEFYETIKAAVGDNDEDVSDRLTPPPKQGSMDINQVFDSSYIFS